MAGRGATPQLLWPVPPAVLVSSPAKLTSESKSESECMAGTCCTAGELACVRMMRWAVHRCTHVLAIADWSDYYYLGRVNNASLTKPLHCPYAGERTIEQLHRRHYRRPQIKAMCCFFWVASICSVVIILAVVLLLLL